MDFFKLALTLIDHSNEATTVSIRTTGDFDDDWTLATAIYQLSNDEWRKVERNAVTTFIGQPPNYEPAQNELKILVGYQDNVTFENYTMEIPAPNTATFVIPAGTDYITMNTGVWATVFIPAFQTAVLSKAGNPVTVRYGRIIGRNA